MGINKNLLETIFTPEIVSLVTQKFCISRKKLVDSFDIEFVDYIKTNVPKDVAIMQQEVFILSTYENGINNLNGCDIKKKIKEFSYFTLQKLELLKNSHFNIVDDSIPDFLQVYYFGKLRCELNIF